MVPNTMDNYFTASAGASAALVGLIFVAISLWPKEQVVAAPPAWRAVGGSSFLAFFNIFLVSLSSLITGLNLGWPVLMLSLIAIINSLLLGFPLLRLTTHWKEHLLTSLSGHVMTLVSLAVYAMEGYLGGRLLIAPNDTSAVEGIAIVLLLICVLGLIRAWELLGVEQLGLQRWLNPLRPPARPDSGDKERDEN